MALPEMLTKQQLSLNTFHLEMKKCFLFKELIKARAQRERPKLLPKKG